MKTIVLYTKEFIIDKNSIEPIIIVQKSSSLDIVVKKDVQASIIELFIDDNNNCNKSIILEDNASLEYLKVQDVKNFADIVTIIQLNKNSTLTMTNLELGLGKVNNNFITNLDVEHANLNIFGLVKLFKNTNSTSIFTTTHNAEHCQSNIKYKHSLHDESKATFQAKTIVNKNARFSKAFQNSNTILLSDNATIFAQPHLEILVDELKASHAATTGSLNLDELLYLRCRGINKDKAYEMLLKAFENEIYDNIKDSKIKEFIKNYKRSDYV